jgi:hypothetical protein
MSNNKSTNGRQCFTCLILVRSLGEAARPGDLDLAGDFGLGFEALQDGDFLAIFALSPIVFMPHFCFLFRGEDVIGAGTIGKRRLSNVGQDS